MALCKYQFCVKEAYFGEYCKDHLNGIDHTVHYKKFTKTVYHKFGNEECKYCAYKRVDNDICCKYHKYVMNLPFEQCTKRMQHIVYHIIHAHSKGKCTECNKNKANVVIWGSNGISTKILCNECNKL